jgi:hypothetical protein
MPKILELTIKDNKKIYQELTQALFPHREKPAGSMLFIVEGTKRKPIIGIRYPGKKLQRRKLKIERANSALWANLYDFEVVPYENGKELNTQRFTFKEMIRDFHENKQGSKEFWEMIEELYEDNTITKKAPNLPGMDPKFYLLILKWIWIQEDLNYRFNWKEVGSSARYVLLTKSGNNTAGGAGRAKFFAALILLKHYFSFKLVTKIIPPY